METGWPVDGTAAALELPPARLHAALGRRRHRRLTLPAGVLLLVCLFLPAIESCGQPVYPLELPYLWHPYIYGGVLAVAALAATVRGLRAAVLAMRILAWLVIAGGVVVTTLNAAFGAVELALGGVLLAIIGTRGASEKRVALTGIVIAVLSLLWFGLWAGSAGALVGVYVSLAASIFLLAGCLLWLSEI